MTKTAPTRRDPLTPREAVLASEGEDAPIALKYDYDQLPAEHRDAIRDAATDIKRRERRAAMDIVEIGRALKSVQARLDHGEFLPWLDQEFGWEQRMAYNFMAVADKFAKFANIEQFGLSALYLLSGPSVPDEAVEEANEAAQRGERVRHKTAKAIVAKHKPAPPSAAPAVVGKCRRCGRPLTDPASVGEACGPTCAAKLAAQTTYQGSDGQAMIDASEAYAAATLAAMEAGEVPADVAAALVEPDEDHIMVACPKCGVEQEDSDGFGVLHCEACGYCVHPSANGGVCDICGAYIEAAPSLPGAAGAWVRKFGPTVPVGALGEDEDDVRALSDAEVRTAIDALHGAVDALLVLAEARPARRGAYSVTKLALLGYIEELIK